MGDSNNNDQQLVVAPQQNWVSTGGPVEYHFTGKLFWLHSPKLDSLLFLGGLHHTLRSSSTFLVWPVTHKDQTQQAV